MTNPLEQAPNPEDKKTTDESKTLPPQGIGIIDVEKDKTNIFDTPKFQGIISKMAKDLEAQGINTGKQEILYELRHVHDLSPKIIKEIATKNPQAPETKIRLSILQSFVKNSAKTKKLDVEISDDLTTKYVTLNDAIQDFVNKKDSINFFKKGDHHIYDSPEMKEIITHITADLQEADPEKEAALQIQNQKVEEALKKIILTHEKQFKQDIIEQIKSNPNEVNRNQQILKSFLKTASGANPTLIKNIKLKLDIINTELGIINDVNNDSQSALNNLKEEYQPKETQKAPSLKELAEQTAEKFNPTQKVTPLFDSSNEEVTKVVKKAKLKKIHDNANKEADAYEENSSGIYNLQSAEKDTPLQVIDEIISRLSKVNLKGKTKTETSIEDVKAQKIIQSRLKVAQSYSSYLREMETLGNPGKMKLLLIPRDEKRLLKEFKKSYLKNKKEAEKTGISFDETIFPNI